MQKIFNINLQQWFPEYTFKNQKYIKMYKVVHNFDTPVPDFVPFYST